VIWKQERLLDTLHMLRPSEILFLGVHAFDEEGPGGSTHAATGIWAGTVVRLASPTAMLFTT
jgi:hypothetical protein